MNPQQLETIKAVLLNFDQRLKILEENQVQKRFNSVEHSNHSEKSTETSNVSHSIESSPNISFDLPSPLPSKTTARSESCVFSNDDYNHNDDIGNNNVDDSTIKAYPPSPDPIKYSKTELHAMKRNTIPSQTTILHDSSKLEDRELLKSPHKLNKGPNVISKSIFAAGQAKIAKDNLNVHKSHSRINKTTTHHNQINFTQPYSHRQVTIVKGESTKLSTDSKVFSESDKSSLSPTTTRLNEKKIETEISATLPTSTSHDDLIVPSAIPPTSNVKRFYVIESGDMISSPSKEKAKVHHHDKDYSKEEERKEDTAKIDLCVRKDGSSSDTRYVDDLLDF